MYTYHKSSLHCEKNGKQPELADRKAVIMKLWKKRISLVLCLVMIAALLSGCMCMQYGAVINKDGSGTIRATVGYSKTLVEMMQSEEDGSGPDLSEYKEKVINGTTYYVTEEERPFASVEEFNELMNGAGEETAQASEQTQKNVSFQLERASDTEFTLTVAVDYAEDYERTDPSGVPDTVTIPPEAADGMTEEDAESMEEMLKLMNEMLIRFEFTFPTYMTVTKGAADQMLSVSGKTVIVDLMKEPAGDAKHVEYVLQSFVPVLKGFRDVPAGAWFAPYVDRSVELGLFSGVTEPDENGLALFAPDRTITRAEFITVVMRAVAPERTYAAVSGAPWYTPYVDAAVELGIIARTDFSDLTAAMTREEMAYVLANAAKYQKVEPDALVEPAAIPDWDTVSEQYRDSVRTTYSLKLITGTDAKGTFLPGGSLTRGQAATVLVRLAELKK